MGLQTYEKGKSAAGLTCSQFIHLTLAKERTGLRGSFSARFNVPDKSAISPDLNFELKSIDETAEHFSWKSADGAEARSQLRTCKEMLYGSSGGELTGTYRIQPSPKGKLRSCDSEVLNDRPSRRFTQLLSYALG